MWKQQASSACPNEIRNVILNCENRNMKIRMRILENLSGSLWYSVSQQIPYMGLTIIKGDALLFFVWWLVICLSLPLGVIGRLWSVIVDIFYTIYISCNISKVKINLCIRFEEISPLVDILCRSVIILSTANKMDSYRYADFFFFFFFFFFFADFILDCYFLGE